MEQLTGDDPAEVAGYRLRARLGAGGMGRVYLAFTGGGQPVALKVVHPEFGDDEDFRDRFRQEVAAARQVCGPYTAQVLDAGPDARPPWLVTAYVAGPSLQEAVAGHGPLPAETVLLLMGGVAEALRAIHAAGIVHQDLKPSNVLLAADGPRVIDFGIARSAQDPAVSGAGTRVVGSPPFMAPEQVLGLPVTPAADVFALGSLAAYAAAGRLPFGEGSAAASLYRVVHTDPDLEGCPLPLRGLVSRCLAKEPAARPSPGEIITECRAHAADLTARIARAWLPATMAADLTRHVPPPAPPARPAVTASQARPGQDGPAPPAAAAPDRPWAGKAPRVARERPDPRRLIAGLAALITAAGAGAGLMALLATGGVPGNSAHTAAAASRQSGAPRGSQAASPRPSRSPDPASCLAGTWKATTVDLVNLINGHSVQFTAAGVTETLGADGTDVTDYGKGTVFSATVSGAVWTDTIEGKLTAHWAAQNGQLLYSDTSAHGTWVLRDNGAFSNSGPLGFEPGPVPFRCSGNTLHEYYPNGSAEMTRQTTARH